MIEQERVEVGEHDVEPGGRRFDPEIEHEGSELYEESARSRHLGRRRSTLRI